jgi:RNA polymerase sigma factor (sigma-70 family)
MPTKPWSVVLQHLLAEPGPGGAGMTDGELLARFVGGRDGGALAALVRRHAPMVWGVCRRLLNHHDAEDAFQATFLVLVRKAAGVPGRAVANWLYGVARQTAVRVRAAAAKRGRREVLMESLPEPAVAEGRDADLRAVLDEEVGRLPGHYRAALVLCDLEGLTRKEAARRLGIPEGSVASRLARARALLARRLTRRGVVTSTGAVAAVGTVMSAPPALVASTIQAVRLVAAGRAAGVLPAQIATLTEGVVQAMFVTKIKGVLVVVLVAGLALGGIGLDVGLTTNPGAVAQAEPPKAAPAKKESPTPPVATQKDEKPPHVVEKPDKKAGVDNFAHGPYQVAGELNEDIILSESNYSCPECRPDMAISDSGTFSTHAISRNTG